MEEIERERERERAPEDGTAPTTAVYSAMKQTIDTDQIEVLMISTKKGLSIAKLKHSSIYLSGPGDTPHVPFEH